MCPSSRDETAVPSDDVSPARRSTLLTFTRSLVSARVLGVIVFGFVVFAVAQMVAARAGNRAEVVMILDQDRVEWPYHDSIRQDAIGRLESSEASAALLADLAGDRATIEADLLSGQSHFSFTVDSADVDRSIEAADALAAWLAEVSMTDRSEGLAEEVEALIDREVALQDDLEDQTELAGQGPSADWSPDQVLAAARFDQLARQLAETERERRSAQATLESLRPQLRPAGPAQPLGRPLSPLTTGLAGAAAALGALAFLRPDDQ